MDEQAARAAVVKEARSWIGTPFRIAARVKGKQGGVDCFTIMAETFRACSISAPWEVEFYRGDFWCHDTKNHYLKTILKYAKQVPASVFDRRPGNIVLVRRAGTRADPDRVTDWHGAIITSWPMVVHAFMPRVAEENALAHPAFQTSGGLVFFNPFVCLEKK